MNQLPPDLNAKYMEIERESNTLCIRFKDWLNTAQPYSTYVYYVGACLSEMPTHRKVRLMIWGAAEKGNVYLFQKRLGVDKYEYRAVKAAYRIARLIPGTHIEENPRRRVLNGVH